MFAATCTKIPFVIDIRRNKLFLQLTKTRFPARLKEL